jgi:sugar phosphate isomerase/epimerase
MKRIPVGLQLYTLRELCAEDFPGTVEKVAEIGYEGVELAGFYGLSPGEVRDLMAEHDLIIAGTHGAGERDIPKLAAQLKELGCNAVWGPVLPEGKLPEDVEGCRAMVKYANQVGAELRKEGIQLYYHNHSKEFDRVEGRYIMDWLLEDTEPENVAAEIDVMWAQHADVDPAAYIRKFPGRVPLAHIKDMDVKHEFTEVGKGVLDFDSIFAACEEVGTRWYIVEQDTCKIDPIESVRISFDFFKSRGMA